jgi:hypothetical protein
MENTYIRSNETRSENRNQLRQSIDGRNNNINQVQNSQALNNNAHVPVETSIPELSLNTKGRRNNNRGKLSFDTNDGRNNNRQIHMKPSTHELDISDKLFEVVYDDSKTYEEKTIMLQKDTRSILKREFHSEIIYRNAPYDKDYYTLYGWCDNLYENIDWFSSCDIVTHITRM